MTRRQIVYFLKIAELRSFSRAAEALHVAQSALSARISELERLIGHRLFERHPRGVALTTVGELFLPRATEIEAAFEKAIAVAAGAASASHRAVRLGVTPSIGSSVVPMLLASAARLDQEVRWSVHQTISVNLARMLADGELDVALCYLKVNAPNVHSSKVSSTEMTVVGRPSSLGHSNGDIAFSELSRLRLVLDPPINPRRQIIEAAAARHGTELRMEAELEPFSAKKVLLLQNGFCAILPRYQVAAELQDGILNSRRIVAPRLPLTLYLARRKELSKEMVAFLRTVVGSSVSELSA